MARKIFLFVIFVFFLSFSIVGSDVGKVNSFNTIPEKEFYSERYQDIDTPYIHFELPIYATHYWMEDESNDIYELIIPNFTIKNKNNYVLKFTWNDERYISETFQIHYDFESGVLSEGNINPYSLSKYDKSCMDNIPSSVSLTPYQDCEKARDESKLRFNNFKVEVGSITGYDYRLELNHTCEEEMFNKSEEISLEDCYLNISYPVYSWSDFKNIDLKLPLNFIAIDDVTISACGVLTTNNTKYALDQDILDSSTSNCIDIGAYNVTLDCQGYTIDGDDSADYGIRIYRSPAKTTNVTIKNCNLTDWDTAGIYLNYADGNFLDNLSLSSNSNDGIYLYQSDSNILTNITSDSNSNDGIYLYLSNLNTLENSNYINNSYNDVLLHSVLTCNNKFINIIGTGNKPIVYYNDTIIIEHWNNNVSELILCNANNSIINNVSLNHIGKENNALSLIASHNVTIKNSNFTDLFYGIYLYQSDSNILTNITCNSNSNDGIYLSSSDSNTLTNITCNSNSDDGIYLFQSDSNTLTNITCNSNSDNGIFLSNSDSNTLTNIISNSNSDDGIYLPASDSNTLTNIISNSNSDNGIHLTNGLSNNLTDSNLSGNGMDIKTSSTTTYFNLLLLNVTYASEQVGTGSNLTRKWYFETNITDLADNPLNNANVTIYNVTGSAIHSELTDSSGEIGVEEIIEYINASGTTSYQTPHIVNVSLSGFTTNSTSVNLTSLNNVRHTVALLPSITLSLVRPENKVYDTNYSLPLNYTITNYTKLDTCWFYVMNSTNKYEVSNRTITGCANATFNVSIDGVYNLYMWVNETGGTSANDSVNFEVSKTAPAVSLNYPKNNSFFKNGTNIYFNFTGTDTEGLGACELWANWTGTWSKRFTWTKPTNDTMNFTTINLTTDVTSIWNVRCNDTSGNQKPAISNRTVNLDTTFPSIFITDINTPSGSQTFTFSHTISELHQDRCKYSIFYLNGTINGLNNNISLTCGALSTSATVTEFGTFSLRIYANDSAGNENYTSETFTTRAIIIGGGGGGRTLSETSTVCLKDLEEYSRSKLQRCILYARIRESCNKKTPCLLSSQAKDNLTYTLSRDFLVVQLTELNAWLKQYNDNELEAVKILDDDVTKFRLFTGIIQIEGLGFQLSPSRIDTFFIALTDNSVFEYVITSNRLLKSVKVLEGSDLGLEAEQLTETSAKVVYKMVNGGGIFSKTVEGKINYISEDGDSIFQDVRIRVISSLIFYILIGIIILIIFSVIFKKAIFKRLRKSKLKDLNKIIG